MADHENDMTFQVSVKGLFFNQEGKIMMILDDEGYWEPVGGRVQKGEDLIEGLKRECLEETGLVCEVVDSQPMIVYSAIDEDGRARIMVYYKIRMASTDFTPGSECLDLKFYTKEEIRHLKLASQIKKLPDLLP